MIFKFHFLNKMTQANIAFHGSFDRLEIKN